MFSGHILLTGCQLEKVFCSCTRSRSSAEGGNDVLRIWEPVKLQKLGLSISTEEIMTVFTFLFFFNCSFNLLSVGNVLSKEDVSVEQSLHQTLIYLIN